MQSDLGGQRGKQVISAREVLSVLDTYNGGHEHKWTVWFDAFRKNDQVYTTVPFSFPGVVELAMIMDRLYGGVCYAGIDTDPELKYPKGAGRVAFSNQQSYIAAISARFVQLQHGEIDKRVRSSSMFYFCSELSLEMLFHVNVCHCEGCKCYLRLIAYLGLDCAT